MVFERAENLEVKVRDQSKKQTFDENGEPVFPEMTKEEVRDQLRDGNDFSLVLETKLMFGGVLEVTKQVSMGIREVEIE